MVKGLQEASTKVAVRPHGYEAMHAGGACTASQLSAGATSGG